jgi:hypothetical protein
LHHKTDFSNVPSLHDPKHTQHASPLHRLGEELLVWVSKSGIPVRPSRYSSLFCLHSQLFGEDEDAVGELDEAEKQGENGTLYASFV